MYNIMKKKKTFSSCLRQSPRSLLSPKRSRSTWVPEYTGYPRPCTAPYAVRCQLEPLTNRRICLFQFSESLLGVWGLRVNCSRDENVWGSLSEARSTIEHLSGVHLKFGRMKGVKTEDECIMQLEEKIIARLELHPKVGLSPRAVWLPEFEWTERWVLVCNAMQGLEPDEFRDLADPNAVTRAFNNLMQKNRLRMFVGGPQGKSQICKLASEGWTLRYETRDICERGQWLESFKKDHRSLV